MRTHLMLLWLFDNIIIEIKRRFRVVLYLVAFLKFKYVIDQDLFFIIAASFHFFDFFARWIPLNGRRSAKAYKEVKLQPRKQNRKQCEQ